jgi:hypothetical protein
MRDARYQKEYSVISVDNDAESHDYSQRYTALDVHSYEYQ